MKKDIYGMESMSGWALSLKSVHLDGQLDGVHFSGALRQKYVNETNETIEAIYTFPLSWSAHLLGVALDLNGNRLEAQALPKKQAEEKYEHAIVKGDTPVMIERTAKGLYTANLGNLKPGEEATIEVKYAQMIPIESGVLRLLVPTVIGDRFGDAVKDGGMAPHQAVESDMLAEYGFNANVRIMGALANAQISCPTHSIEIESQDDGQCVRIIGSSFLDRDFVLLLKDEDVNSSVVVAKDGEEFAAIASFCPLIPAECTKEADLSLKLLVDCSGSMQGESMEQAQEALFELSQKLKENDMLSYTKFGSNVDHVVDQLMNCSSAFIKNQLAKAIHETDADMGGTNLNKALTESFKISFSKSYSEGSDILLITDGQVWNVDEVIKQARRSNHRIFAIGVGSAPAESLLRELAEQTGGACALVTPNENIQAAVLSLLAKLRAAQTSDLSIAWDAPVIWQSKLPKRIFSGETVNVYARLSSKPASAPALSWKVGELGSKVQASHVEETNNTAVVKMAAASELAVIHDERVATDIAIKYQLLSEHTNLFLVHVRSDETKADGLPKVEQIQQMHAAGWGGVGRVTQQSRRVLRVGTDGAGFPLAAASMEAPAVWRASRVKSDTARDGNKTGFDDFEIPAFLRKQEDVADFTPVQLIEVMNRVSSEANSLRKCVESLALFARLGPVANLIRESVKNEGEKFDAALAQLILWIENDVALSTKLNRHAARLVREAIAKISAEQALEIANFYRHKLRKISESSWGIKEKTKLEKMIDRVGLVFKK